MHVFNYLYRLASTQRLQQWKWPAELQRHHRTLNPWTKNCVNASLTCSPCFSLPVSWYLSCFDPNPFGSSLAWTSPSKGEAKPRTGDKKSEHAWSKISAELEYRYFSNTPSGQRAENCRLNRDKVPITTRLAMPCCFI